MARPDIEHVQSRSTGTRAHRIYCSTPQCDVQGTRPIAVTGNCIRETKRQQASTTPAGQTTPGGGF